MADFLVLSTADWDHPLWTNKQHVAFALAREGHRVLYVESLGLRRPRAGSSDRGRILRRLSRCLRPPRRVGPGLWVISPLVLPGAWVGLPLRLNRLLLRLWLSTALLQLRFRRPIVWTYNPLTTLAWPGSLSRPLVYHCVDRIQDQPGMPVAVIEQSERALCAAADIVFTTAPVLQRSLAALNPRTIFYANVADFDHFQRACSPDVTIPADLAALATPRVGFIGAIDGYKLDLPLLTELSSTTPAWSYVMVGPIGQGDPCTDVAALARQPNVHFLGPRPYAELPALLAGIDVALLPLRLNSYTRHMFPMKFFEYLAAGRPVVATAIPSLEPYAEAALLVSATAAAFRQAIATCLGGGGPSPEARRQLAARHTYTARTRHMLEDLRRCGLPLTP